MAQLARALNATLDELADDRNQLETWRRKSSAPRKTSGAGSRGNFMTTRPVLFAQLLQVSALKSSADPNVQAVATNWNNRPRRARRSSPIGAGVAAACT